jgi:hypothetical protein
MILDQSDVAVVDIDLGVVCFVDESGQGFTFVVFFVVFHELLYMPHCLSCIGIVFNSWLVFFYGLGQRFQVIRSWHVMLVHSRRVHSHPYFVCDFSGPVTTSMLNPVLRGGESIFLYFLMIRLVIFFHSLPLITSYCLICLRSSHWNPSMLLDSVISSLRMYS